MITIKTQLHEGIYRSSGGGQVEVHFEASVNPQNLIKAVKFYYEWRKRMEQNFGSIGKGKTWMEIDAAVVSADDIWSSLDENGKLTIKEADKLIAWARKNTLNTAK